LINKKLNKKRRRILFVYIFSRFKSDKFDKITFDKIDKRKLGKITQLTKSADFEQSMLPIFDRKATNFTQSVISSNIDKLPAKI